MDQNNLTLVEQRFWSNDHDFNRDAKITIIKTTGKDINIKAIIEKRQKNKKFEMSHLDLIRRLNQPTP